MVLSCATAMHCTIRGGLLCSTAAERLPKSWTGRQISTAGTCWAHQMQADILVSELLGSFGDNELSPECLDGAQRFLKRGGVSIPAAYTSQLQPISSFRVWSDVKVLNIQAYNNHVSSQPSTFNTVAASADYIDLRPQSLLTPSVPCRTLAACPSPVWCYTACVACALSSVE